MNIEVEKRPNADWRAVGVMESTPACGSVSCLSAATYWAADDQKSITPMFGLYVDRTSFPRR